MRRISDRLPRDRLRCHCRDDRGSPTHWLTIQYHRRALLRKKIYPVYEAQVHLPSSDTILLSGSTLVCISLRRLTLTSENLFAEISYSGCLAHLGGVRIPLFPF